jgi:3-phenylpropionate/trans-cinnamate dioxygenase ferredoxin reductase subunit
MLGQQVSYDRCRTSSPTSTTSAWSSPGGSRLAGMTRWSPAVISKRTFYAFWLAGDRVVAGMHVNQWDPGIAPVQDLIRSAAPVDHHRLADPAVPFTELLSRHGDIWGFQSAR